MATTQIKILQIGNSAGKGAANCALFFAFFDQSKQKTATRHSEPALFSRRVRNLLFHS
jgi:hypothetical protein